MQKIPIIRYIRKICRNNPCLSKKLIATYIVAVIMALLSVQPGFGAEINLKTRVGFGGYVVPGTLTPVFVETNRVVDNGRLEIVNPGKEGAYSVIDSFPIHNFKRVEASVYANENFNNLKIRLISGKQRLIETGLKPKAKLYPGNVVLAVKAPSSARQAIERTLLPVEPVLVVATQVAELPGTALNYDCVSGLVISDPGPVLKPLQVQALKAWLAGGGRIVLGSTRSGSDSLLSMIGIENHNSEPSFYQVGFGGITAFQGEFIDLKPNAVNWKESLNLKPYIAISRLMANKIFPDYKADSLTDASHQSSRVVFYLAMVLILWAVSGLLIIISAKRNRALFLFCFILLWTVVSFPIGRRLAGLWNRGAEINSRNIILPEVGWMFTDVKVRLNQSSSGRTINFQSSPWGGIVSIGEESHGKISLINSVEAFSWPHPFSQAKTAIKTAGPGWVNIIGWFPLNHNYSVKINALESIGKWESNSDLVVWDGKRFYKLPGFQPAGWEELGQPPDWLRDEEDWLNKLKEFDSETVWLIGRAPLSDIVIKIEKGVFRGELWAAPLPEGVNQ